MPGRRRRVTCAHWSTARLLRHERDGRSRVYSIEPARLRLIADWIAWFQKPLTPPE